MKQDIVRKHCGVDVVVDPCNCEYFCPLCGLRNTQEQIIEADFNESRNRQQLMKLLGF